MVHSPRNNSTRQGRKLELRDAYFKPLYERVFRDRSVMVLVGDFSAEWIAKIERDFPSQFVNCGIAEQNMISVAAGLALSGKRPYVCAINNFLTLRAFEQISVDVCSMKLPVTLVGVGAGYTYTTDGPTHHGVTDMGAMMQMPIDIFNCSDAIVTGMVAEHVSDGPTYVRLNRGEAPEYPTPYQLGHGIRALRPGKALLVSSGYMVGECMKEDPSYGVIDIFRVKPINEELLKFMCGDKEIIVVEDNLNAPLHKAVSTILGRRCKSVAPTQPVFEYGSREFIHRKAGILV